MKFDFDADQNRHQLKNLQTNAGEMGKSKASKHLVECELMQRPGEPKKVAKKSKPETTV